MIDPYIVPHPRFIVNSDGTASPEFEQWLIYDNRFKHDLWQKLGGGEDIVNDQQELRPNEALLSAFNEVYRLDGSIKKIDVETVAGRLAALEAQVNRLREKINELEQLCQ